jgi:hypothetical protein
MRYTLHFHKKRVNVVQSCNCHDSGLLRAASCSLSVTFHLAATIGVIDQRERFHHHAMYVKCGPELSSRCRLSIAPRLAPVMLSRTKKADPSHKAGSFHFFPLDVHIGSVALRKAMERKVADVTRGSNVKIIGACRKRG